MLKEARKPSSDPAQEKLRQEKATWNKDVSALINDIIHLKKTMNGWPSKFYQQRSRISDPIPADPATIIGSLAGDFQNLSQRAEKIVQEQLNYSKTRRKKQPAKTPGLPSTAPPAPATPEAPAAPAAPNLSQQLSAATTEYQLLAEASNPVTRFFTKLITPTRGGSEGARIRRFRMSLLTASAKTYKDLGKLQAAIVGSSKESATTAHKLMQQTWNDWSLVTRGFSIYKSTMPAQAVDQGGELPEPSLDLPEEKQNELDKFETGPAEVTPPREPQSFDTTELMTLAKAAIADYKRASARSSFSYYAPLADDLFQKFNQLIGRFTTLPNNLKNHWAKSVVEEYRSIVTALNQKYGTAGGTLSQIADILDAKAKAAIPPGVHMPKAAQLEVVAQTFLKKWLGKARHQMMPKDTSSYRLEVYKLGDTARKNINKIMDLLEKGMDVNELLPIITEVNKQMTQLRLLVRSIHFAEKPNEAPPLTSLF